MMKIFRLTTAILIIFALLEIIQITSPSIKAQNLTDWSPRKRIPGSQDDAETPYMLADQGGNIHVFHSQPVRDGSTDWAIFYSKWTLKGGWTDAIDVILAPDGQAAIIRGIFLDKRGYLHIIFVSDSRDGANLYYSSAPVLAAGAATSWSKPHLIGEEIFIDMAALLADDQGNVYVLYGGSPEQGKGLYFVRSTDTGVTWSEPTPIFLTYDATLFVYGLQVYLDQQGTGHAVWTVNNANGAGQTIYYAHLEANQEVWSDPIILAKIEDQDKRLEKEIVSRVGHPAIVKQGNEIIVVYIVCDPCERRMRRSTDNGETWTEAVEPFPSRGEYGWADFVIDSSNTLHMFLGDRGSGLTLWHAVWKDGLWQDLEPIVPQSETTYEGPQAFHPWFPHAAISQGNTILVTWTTDEGVADNGTWYTYKTLNTPSLPIIPLPTPPPVATSTPNPTPTVFEPEPTATVRHFVIEQENLNSSSNSNNQATPLILGIVPVVLLIFGIVIVRHLNSY